jgi:hypothetical protein
MADEDEGVVRGESCEGGSRRESFNGDELGLHFGGKRVDKEIFSDVDGG